MTTLGPLFTKPLHVAKWKRPVRPLKDWNAFRVTGTYDGEDLINGGLHRAVDVGNASKWGSTGLNEAILAPLDCWARGGWHFDGALMVEFALTPDLILRLAHLNQTLPVTRPVGRTTSWGTAQQVTLGQKVGLTGATGLGTGAHTHIELWDHGVRIDPEPFLVMAERPAQPLPEDDMQIKGDNLRHIQNRVARVTADTSFRSGPSTSDTRIDVLNQGAALYPICVVTGAKVGTSQDATDWYGAIKTAGVQGNQFGFVHSSLLPRSKDGKGVALELVESGFTNEDMANALVKGRAQMKRDIETAVSRVAA